MVEEHYDSILVYVKLLYIITVVGVAALNAVMTSSGAISSRQLIFVIITREFRLGTDTNLLCTQNTFVIKWRSTKQREHKPRSTIRSNDAHPTLTSTCTVQ